LSNEQLEKKIESEYIQLTELGEGNVETGQLSKSIGKKMVN
jgi:hypothetical protein